MSQTQRTAIHEVYNTELVAETKKPKKVKAKKLKGPKGATVLPEGPRESLADLTPEQFRARAVEALLPGGDAAHQWRHRAPMTLDEYLRGA